MRARVRVREPPLYCILYVRVRVCVRGRVIDMVVGVGLAAAAGMGAVGGIVANIALTPLTAGAGLLQSYWYGAGLILGERMMYTVHWEKIKVRLDNKENFMDILDQEMNDDITAIATLAFKAMDKTAEIFHSQATISLGAFIEDLIAAALNPFFSGDRDPSEPPSEEENSDLISRTAEQIKAWDLGKLQFEREHNLHLYDATTQIIIKQIYDLRIDLSEDPNQPCPEGMHKDPVSGICVSDTVPDANQIPRITRTSLKIHSVGRTIATFNASTGQITTYTGQTNPQRNGNWQTKKTFTGATMFDDSKAWLHTNFPQPEHNTYTVQQTGVYKERYHVRKSDITIQNFP